MIKNTDVVLRILLKVQAFWESKKISQARKRVESFIPEGAFRWDIINYVGNF